jgi:hypothetical protein
MIGGAARRRAVTAIVIALGVGIGLGLRSADPSQADPLAAAARLQSMAAAAAAADDALAQLSSVLAAALDHARRGAALTVAGVRAPAPELAAAADQLTAGADTADAVRRALAALAGTAASVTPGREVPALPYSGPELLLMAAQLNASAQAATLFVERRHAAEAVVSALGDAVAALERDQPAAALRSLDAATAPLALLEGWHDRPALLGYWMTIAGNLLDAARGIATATIDGNPSALQAAAARYAAASTTARGADNALAVSIAEEGSAVSSIPLRRLAVAAGEAIDLRSALRTLTHSVS